MTFEASYESYTTFRSLVGGFISSSTPLSLLMTGNQETRQYFTYNQKGIPSADLYLY